MEAVRERNKVCVPEPGVKVLFFFDRPIAVWMESTGRVYLLYGWDAFSSTAQSVRRFVCKVTGTVLSNAADLRNAAKCGDKVVNCSLLCTTSLDEIKTLMDLEKKGALWRGDFAPVRSAQGTYTDSMLDATGDERSLSLTKLLEEWFGNPTDLRSDDLARSGFNAQSINRLLQEEGFLGADKLPTEKGLRAGIKAAHWHKDDGTEALYALYPCENADMYRDLIYTLAMRGRERLDESTERARIDESADTMVEKPKNDFIINTESTRDD